MGAGVLQIGILITITCTTIQCIDDHRNITCFDIIKPSGNLVGISRGLSICARTTRQFSCWIGVFQSSFFFCESCLSTTYNEKSW